MAAETKPLSEDEALKERSRFLRGTIVESLADAATGALAPSRPTTPSCSSSTALTNRTTGTCATNASGRNSNRSIPF